MGPRISECKSILVIRLDQVGDMVMMSPFLRELRRNAPEARISLVVNPLTRELVQYCPHVDEVLTCAVFINPWMRRTLGFLSPLVFAMRFLRRRKFDLALVPRWDVDYYFSTLIAAFSAASCSVGYSERVNGTKEKLNRGRDRLLTVAMEGCGVRHEVERNLEMLRYLGGSVSTDTLENWVTEADNAFAENVFANAGISPDDQVIAMCPSCGHSSLKQWPLERFVELGRLLKQNGYRIMLLGGEKDRSAAARIAQAAGDNTVNLAGQASLRQAAAILSRCRLFIGNDTGPAHLATAAGIPVVALFGASCPHRFGPRSAISRVLRADMPCNRCRGEHHPDQCPRCVYRKPRCLFRLEAGHVLAASQDLLKRTAARAAGGKEKDD